MLFRFALFVAVCVLILIGSGAVITSVRGEASAQDAAGAALPAAAESPPANPISVATEAHVALAIGAGVLVVALAGWLWTTKRGSLRALAGFAVVSGGVDAWVATRTPLDPGVAVLHAWLAAVFFASICGIALVTSPRWSEEPELVDDRGLRFLRPLAIAAPPLVLIQIVLGAMYRHKMTSVFWHMGGAMLVSLATLVAAMVVIQQYPEHRQLHGSAVALMSVVLVQVGLGVTAFTLELLEVESVVALRAATVAHVVGGSLTLGVSLILAVWVRRCLLFRK